MSLVGAILSAAWDRVWGAASECAGRPGTTGVMPGAGAVLLLLRIEEASGVLTGRRGARGGLGVVVSINLIFGGLRSAIKLRTSLNA